MSKINYRAFAAANTAYAASLKDIAKKGNWTFQGGSLPRLRAICRALLGGPATSNAVGVTTGDDGVTPLFNALLTNGLIVVDGKDHTKEGKGRKGSLYRLTDDGVDFAGLTLPEPPTEEQFVVATTTADAE